MSADFSGTHSEKFDKLAAATMKLRTTMRIGFAALGVGFPLIVALLSFLVVQSLRASAKVDCLSDQIAGTRGDYLRLDERLDRPERAYRL